MQRGRRFADGPVPQRAGGQKVLPALNRKNSVSSVRAFDRTCEKSALSTPTGEAHRIDAPTDEQTAYRGSWT